MAGLVKGFTGLFGQLGGSSSKTDRAGFMKNISNLNDIFGTTMNQGGQLYNAGRAATGQGLQDLGTSGNFFRRLASGNRVAATQAMAPQINAATQQADAQRRQEAALGTARGGGTAGLNQTADTNRLASIDNMLFGAQTGAAGELANVGRTEAGIGLGETGQGLTAENIGREAETSAAGLNLSSRELSDKLHRQAVQDYSDAFQSLLSNKKGLGGLATKAAAWLGL